MADEDREKPPSEAEVTGAIFKRMDGAGYLQPILDLIVGYSQEEEKRLRVLLRQIVITDGKALADVHVSQGRLSACARIITNLRTLSGRGARHPLERPVEEA